MDVLKIRLQRLARTITARTVYAGKFGGVAATNVLAYLAKAGPEKDELVALVYDGVRHGKAPDNAALEAQFDGTPDLVHSLTQWPQEFWSALNHVWRLHQHDAEDDLETRTYLNAGVSRMVNKQLNLFLHRAERAIISTHRDPLHRYESAVRHKFGAIQLVLERLPPKWESYIRRNIEFVVAFSQDVREDKRISDYAIKSKLSKEYNIRFSTERASGLYPMESNTDNALYDAASRRIILFNKADNLEVAHEIGHAIWEASYTPSLLRAFLRRAYKASRAQLLSAKLPVHKDEDHLERDITHLAEGFYVDFRQRLNGLKMDKPAYFVRNLVKNWGKDYPDHTTGVPSVRAIAAQLDGYQGKMLDKLVQDNKQFLAAWDEHWAEGFAYVLMRHEDTSPNAIPDPIYEDELLVRSPPSALHNIPYAILSLIHHILSL